jgi:hypothetical protein
MTASRTPSSPKKHYGVIPSLEMITFLFMFAVCLTCLCATVLTDQVSQPGIDGWITLGFFAVLTGIHLFVVLKHLPHARTTYRGYKKLHYYRQHIKPYLLHRYGINVRMDNINDIKMLEAGTLSVYPDDGFTGIKGFFLIMVHPVNGFSYASAPWGHAMLHGAGILDSIASGERTEPVAEDEILLLRKEERMLSEFGRVDDPDAAPVDVFQQDNTPSLAQLEQSVTKRVYDILSTTKGGDFYLRVSTPDVEDEPVQLLTHASFVRDDLNNATYYRSAEIDAVVNAIVFSVRMYGCAFLTVIHVDPQNKGTVAGVALYETSSRAMRESELKALRTAVGKNMSCGVPEYRWSPHLV